jgi:predicted molibdopterin-dependent oxidoreductase YjgC
MCLVEVEGSTKLAAACMTPVGEGMVIRTHTEKLREYRRMILELRFAERNHVCSVCVADGRCELQDLAVAHGMDDVRFEYHFPGSASTCPTRTTGWTTTVAYCAPGACGSATRWKARTPGTSPVEAPAPASSPT